MSKEYCLYDYKFLSLRFSINNLLISLFCHIISFRWITVCYNNIFCFIFYRNVVIDLSAGPCTYGKIETEEGSVSYRTVPRFLNILFPRGQDPISASSTYELVTRQLSALIYTTIEHVIAPDVRYCGFQPLVPILIC